jgi:hypothetical protein
MATQSKLRLCCRSLAGVVGSNPNGGMNVYLFSSVMCRQVEVSATGRSLVESSPTEYVCVCSHIECDQMQQ